ncbi:MAG: hypothetical protein WCI97_03600 [Bacteroidota bacterium]
MKKLLSINFSVILFLIASCNSQHAETNNSVLIAADTLDTFKVVKNDSVKVTVMKKDTQPKQLDGKAIIHKGPNQEKIDSIKKAKPKK